MASYELEFYRRLDVVRIPIRVPQQGEPTIVGANGGVVGLGQDLKDGIVVLELLGGHFLRKRD